MATQHFTCSWPMTVAGARFSQHHTVQHRVNLQHQN